MALSLQGKVFAITGPRRHSELSVLIQKIGGVPYIAPLVEISEEELSPEAESFVSDVCRGVFTHLLFMTGQAVRDFLREAERIQGKQAALSALRKVFLIARGHKADAVLRAHGLSVNLFGETSDEVLQKLNEFDMAGAAFGVVHYGLLDRDIEKELENRGAAVRGVKLYRSTIPRDRNPALKLIEGLVTGRIDVVSFTSALAVHNLFEIAQEIGRVDELRSALMGDVVVAVAGPVAASALEEFDVEPDVVPAQFTAPLMIKEVAALFERSRSLSS